jgi:putative membrane protein
MAGDVMMKRLIVPSGLLALRAAHVGWRLVDAVWSSHDDPFVGAVVFLAVLLVRWLLRPRAGEPSVQPAKTPLDILRERFARGEIDKEEFEERRRVLGA